MQGYASRYITSEIPQIIHHTEFAETKAYGLL